jgi:hypothetical protein
MGLNFGQNLFPPRGELLVNYDYSDISEGIGYNTYYGSLTTNGSALITPSKVYSESIHSQTRVASLETAFTKYEEFDFDITFNMPKNVKGKIIINVPIGVSNDDGATRDYYGRIDVDIYHYDGSTETQIGSTATGIEFKWEITDGNIGSSIASCMVDASLKHFKKGETLRFTIKAYFKAQAVGYTCNVGIGHDPTSRTDATLENTTDEAVISGATIMSFTVPYVLDI